MPKNSKKWYRVLLILLGAISLSLALIATPLHAASAESAGFHYQIALEIKLNESDNSLSVKARIDELKENPLKGDLIISLYEKGEGVNRLVDIFSCSASGPAPRGKLSIKGAKLRNLEIKAAVWSAENQLLQLSDTLKIKLGDFFYAVSTLEPQDITKTSAILMGKVNADTGLSLNVSDYGFVLSESQGEIREIAAEYISDDGTFSAAVTDLEDGAEYTYFATGIEYYGEAIKFSTNTDCPDVVTTGAVQGQLKDGLWTYYLGGKVLDARGFYITAKGIQKAPNPNITHATPKTNQSDSGNIISVTEYLLPGETLYFRAFAQTTGGISYGEIMSVKTPPIEPVFNYDARLTFDPETWTATFSASLYSNGGDDIISYGFRYKPVTEEDWIYLTPEPIDRYNRFSAQLSGQNQLPIGVYEAEAYASNSVGMTTIRIPELTTPSLPTLYTTIDSSSILADSAVLKGEITGYCLFRGFEYREESSQVWLEAGMEEHSGTQGSFNLLLDKLKPNTRYVVRAKATGYAGTAYGGELTFTTLFSSIPKETVYKMRQNGKSAAEAMGILKNNYKADIEEALESMLFAGYSANDAVGTAVSLSYAEINDHIKVGKVLKSLGCDAFTLTNILKTHYSGKFYGSSAPRDIKEALLSMEYSQDSAIKALAEIYTMGTDTIYAELGITSQEAYSALIRIYGIEQFASMYWSDHEEFFDAYYLLKKLAQIIKVNTALDISQTALILTAVYPSFDMSLFVDSFKELYSLEEIRRGLIEAFSTDILSMAQALYVRFPKDEVNDLLIGTMEPDPVTLLRLLWRCYDRVALVQKVPQYLDSVFGIISPVQASVLMDQANRLESSIYNMYNFMDLIRQCYGVDNAYDFITILKEMGLSAIEVADSIDKYNIIRPVGTSWREVWLAEYIRCGYTSVDIGNWALTWNYSGIDAARYIKQTEGLGILDAAIMLNEVYGLTSTQTQDILIDCKDYIYPWTQEDIENAILAVYGVNVIEQEIEQMKSEGKTASQITSVLKNKYGRTYWQVSDYLRQAAFTMEEVLTAVSSSFNYLQQLPFMQMLMGILIDDYSENPGDHILFLLQMHEEYKWNFENEMRCIQMMQNLGFGTKDYAFVLKEYYKLSAFNAGKMLLSAKKDFHVYIDQSEIIYYIKQLYEVNFLETLVTDYRDDDYSAAAVAGILEDEFDIKELEALAVCLKDGGYSLEQILSGLYQVYLSEKSASYQIDTLSRIYKNVFSGITFSLKTVLVSIIGNDNTHSLFTLLPAAGYTVPQIIEVLKEEYNLSVGETINLLQYHNVSLKPDFIREVFGANSITELISQQVEQGKDIDEIYSFLKNALNETELSRLHAYLKEAGFDFKDFMDMMYGKQDYSYSDIYSVVQSVYGDTDIIQEYLLHLKEKGSSITACYDYIRNEFGISNPQVIAQYLGSVGFTMVEINRLFYSRQDYDGLTILEALQETYKDIDVIAEFIKYERSRGISVSGSYFVLNQQFGLEDVAEITRYLSSAGYNDNEILAGMESCVRYHAITILHTLYPEEDIEQLLVRLKNSPIQQFYAFNQLIENTLTEFPETEFLDILMSFKEAAYYGEYTSKRMGEFLSQPEYGTIIPLDQRAIVAKYMGAHGLDIELIWAVRFTKLLPEANIKEAARVLVNNGYESVEVWKAINNEYGDTSPYHYETLKAFEYAGLSFQELVILARSYFASSNSVEDDGTIFSFKPILGLGKSMPETIAAYLNEGAQPRLLITLIYEYARDRFRDETTLRLLTPTLWQALPYHYPYSQSDLRMINIVTWVRDELKKLPEELIKDIDIIQQAADGIYRAGPAPEEIFEAMYYIAKEETSRWNVKLPRADIEVLGELLILINKVITIGANTVQDILTEISVISALRMAGCTTERMTFYLKEIGDGWLMNIGKQALGGYNLEDAWDAVMSYSYYRNQFGWSVLWSIFTKFYDVPTYVTIIKYVVDYRHIVEKLGKALIDAV